MIPQEVEIYLKKNIADLKKEMSDELKKIKKFASFEMRKADEKIIEIETVIEQTEGFELLKIDGCIFFADDEGKLGELDNDEPKTLPYEPIFLLVPYEKFQSYLNKDFYGDGFTYQLKPNYQFIEAENKISRLAQIYHEQFQIYSPYARRAVDIRISDKSADDFSDTPNLDFKLDENNLSDKLVMNKKFFWNVESQIVGMWRNREGYGYDRNADALEYILPNCDQNLDCKIDVKTSDDRIFFETELDFLSENCELIKILPIKNKIAPRIFTKPRLRTQADINFVLKCFERENYSCTFKKFGGEGDFIKRYDGEHKYFTSADEDLLRAKRNLPVCVIKFSGDEIFLTDYANYVLNFLEWRYPEFKWVGVSGNE